MRILTYKRFILSALTICFSSTILFAQEKIIRVSQDSKFEKLLNEKRKINASLTVNESYKIQIYNGGSEIAKKTLSEFKLNFADIDATIVFNTPNYKVWVGNFRTRIEAERNLVEIKKKYLNVLLIKPSR